MEEHPRGLRTTVGRLNMGDEEKVGKDSFLAGEMLSTCKKQAREEDNQETWQMLSLSV